MSHAHLLEPVHVSLFAGDRVPTGVWTKRDCTAIRRSRPQLKAIATYRVHELVE
jgi:hypothetical protein